MSDVAFGRETRQEDLDNLECAEKKFRLIRDAARCVADHRSTGCYIYGGGGCGKSHNILGELEQMKVPYKLSNSRMTGWGLFEALMSHPDEVHVLEDMEQMFNDPLAPGVLRSALWANVSAQAAGPLERLITWSTKAKEHRVVFTGGIIMTGNWPFPNRADLDAIKTRITYLHLSLSDNEVIALMRRVASQGYCFRDESMDEAECGEVCEFIISECLGLRRQLDLRMLVNAFRKYLQWRDCGSGCDWKDLVAADVKERPTLIREAQSMEFRGKQRLKELELAKEIATIDRGERYRLWRERTGKSEKSLYRRIAEAKVAT